MAKKQPPKPISVLRHDFVASLENLCQQSMMMLQVVDTILKHPPDSLKSGVLTILAERSKALREALVSDD